MSKPKIVVGLELDLRENLHYRGELRWWRVLVSKVGRKYFQVKCVDGSSWIDDSEFFIENWKAKKSSRITLHVSREEYELELQAEKLQREIGDKISNWIGYGRIKLSLEALNKIQAIIDEDTKQ